MSGNTDEAGRLRTAYHELGHVIACEELNVLSLDVSIEPRDDGTLGRVPVEGDDGFCVPFGTDPYSPENEAAYRAWAEEQAIIDYAGHAAVAMLLGHGDMSDSSAEANGAGEDFGKARDRLGNDPARIESAKARACEIVASKSGEIEALAKELLRRGVLGGDQVSILLGQLEGIRYPAEWLEQAGLT